MLNFQYDIACCILVSFSVFSIVRGNWEGARRHQLRALRLPDTTFNFNEYSEYTDNDDKDRGASAFQWKQKPLLNHNAHVPIINNNITKSDALDKSIEWDSHWVPKVKFGQISAVSIDPNGNIAIFHRGSRTWGINTFDNANRFDQNNGPVRENTIVLLDKSGNVLLEWGKDMFYLPHGLTIDSAGNYWITDVALHQVFRFDAKDIQKYTDDLKKQQLRTNLASESRQDTTSITQRNILKPSIVLGEAFVPGNDDKRFCKPTAVAVQKDGVFFVSDGYCNTRIIKYNAKGEKILQWGRHWGTEGTQYTQSPSPYAFLVPHALALAEELNYVFVADRENGRVLSFLASNGSFHKEYEHPVIGRKVYSVAYAQGKIYLINGPDMYNSYMHVRGFVLDVDSGNVLSQFGPGQDMERPHDLAVTENGSEIYVAELDLHITYRFLHDVNTSGQTGKSVAHKIAHHEPAPLTDSNSQNLSTGGTATATLVLSLVIAAVIFIALCVAIAAVVARYQKRGCLLTMRKRMRWEAERRENFKLSSFLESRRGKGFKLLEKRPNPRDFSKLNTEPETSEDEHQENNLTKII